MVQVCYNYYGKHLIYFRNEIPHIIIYTEDVNTVKADDQHIWIINRLSI